MIVLVYGVRGAGKTTLARRVLEDEVRREPVARGILIDTLLEPGHRDLVRLELKSIEPWLRDPKSRGRTVRVAVPVESDLLVLYRQLAQGGAVTRGERASRVVLYVEECSYWCRANYTAEGLSRAVRYGRHIGIDIVAVARRPAEISRELSSQAERVLVFRAIEPTDLSYYRGLLPETALERLPNLPRWHYIDYKVGSGWSERLLPDPRRPSHS